MQMPGDTPPSNTAQTVQYRYVIRVQGQLDSHWSEWFDGMTVIHDPGGITILEGPVADQAALQGLLAKLRNLNLALVSVQRLDSESSAAQ